MKKKQSLVKVVRNIFLLICFFLSLPSYAQKEGWKELVKKNMELKDELAKAVSDTLFLSKKNNDFKILMSEMDERISSINQQIEDIQSSVDPKNISVATLQVDSLAKVKSLLDSTKRSLSSELSMLKKQLTELQRELSNMGVYNTVKNDRIFADNMLVLSKRYSEITDDELRAISESINLFAYRKDFNEYEGRVAAIIRNRSLYQKAQTALNTQYDAEVVDGIRDELYKLLTIDSDDVTTSQFKLTEQQFSQIDSLDIRLSRYKNGVRELKAVVVAINTSEDVNKYRSLGDKEKCINAIAPIILPDNDNMKRVYERYFNLIPFLKRMLDEYWHELQENPLTPSGPIESQIEKM